MNAMGEGWGVCSEVDRWLSGPSKTLGWRDAIAVMSCGGTDPGKGAQLQPLHMRPRGMFLGGYRKPSNWRYTYR